MNNSSAPQPTKGRIRRWHSSVRRVARLGKTSFVRTIQDPILPLLILSVIGIALFASFVLRASDGIVLGVIFIGVLTAFLEIKMRNDNRD